MPSAHSKSKARLSYLRPCLKNQSKQTKNHPLTETPATSSHMPDRWSEVDRRGGHRKETKMRAKLTLQAKSTEPKLQPASHHTPGSGTLGLEAAHACVNR